MKSLNSKYRFLFAGGGTGGHLYPAIAVAEKLVALKSESDLLFIGTSKKIESRVVPKLGYKFKSIWISGFARKFAMKNILFPLKLIVSSLQALGINMSFKPSVAIGTGAYVSGPAIWAAKIMGAKIVLLEQNSFPGITNRMLEKKADKIFIAFEDSKKYFREKEKLVVTGNPVRTNLQLISKDEAVRKFGLSHDKKTLLIFGGSLGAKSINDAVAKSLDSFMGENIQVIWQCGEIYFENYKQYDSDNVKVLAFIDDVAAAYSAADLILCRAGATTIAEISALNLPAIFVPSPNVAADHQFKNAKALADADAAILINDKDAMEKLAPTAIGLLNDEEKLKRLKNNVGKFSNPKAAEKIAESILKLAEEN
ncbi:MAG: undecaprenyldiphospho-muramoylpentapeptide beta-N-acetylglucosaminyltransferase [Chlorobi bacterium]|nr:undecaprenyldiphospho-muramoylpentapeptide beta-N-acetylglucosaminyltransferase [Chlorobiota bacterium]